MQRHGGVEPIVLHSRVVDKNQEGYLGSEESQPHTRPHSHSARKINPCNFWL